MDNFRLKQDGITVAWAGGSNAIGHIAHYAAVYSQDGPVQIEWRVGARWKKLTDSQFRSLLSAHRKEEEA